MVQEPQNNMNIETVSVQIVPLICTQITLRLRKRNMSYRR